MTEQHKLKSQGIHHITAIASDPLETVKFYTQVLGLRLVKKTVNQDQTEAYHLFFGDRTGEPGMDLTFFTFPNIPKGEAGVGQVTAVSLAVSDSSQEFWQQRLAANQVEFEIIDDLFDTQRLRFSDPDGLTLELVFVPKSNIEQMAGEVWTTDEIKPDQAIACFYSARLEVTNSGIMSLLLEKGLGYKLSSELETEAYHSYQEYRQSDDLDRASRLELIQPLEVDTGLNAAGTVHHIAYAVSDQDELEAMGQQIRDLGLDTTDVIDRYYFKSIYFRTPSGILFELATNGPGFTADEAEAELGKNLALPPFLEPFRQQIEANLEPVSNSESNTEQD